jgi:hypothetical protein
MAKYIDKEKLLLFMAEKYCVTCTKIDPMCTACLVDDMRFEIADAPTEDVVEVVHGRWIIGCYGYLDGTDARLDFKCSICGEESILNYNHCPECGAKMDGKGDAK